VPFSALEVRTRISAIGSLSLVVGLKKAMRGDSSVTLTILSSPTTEHISFSLRLKVPDLEQTMRRLAASTHLAPLAA
jgi:hypothetical protein